MASFPLDKRCKEILQSIIYASGFIKVQTIADQMGVSKRSIYYDLNKINDWLRCNSMPEMKQQRAKGIFIEETYKKKIQEILFGQKETRLNQNYTPKERQRLEMCITILRNKNLYIEDYMDICNVSRNTIIADLKVVSDYLHKQGLNLVYTLKSGYRIMGDAIKKRAIFFLFFPPFFDYYANSILNEAQNQALKEIFAKLRQIEFELHAEYVSGTLSTLAAFIYSIHNQKDQIDFTDMDQEEIESTKEYQLVQKTFQDLDHKEILYLSLHLLGSRLQTIPVNISDQSEQSRTIATLLVDKFEQISGIQYDHKDELIRALTAHLSTSMYRYRYGIQLGNPMLESIQTEYSELFELTKSAFQQIKDEIHFDISDAEIAYLTLHFGAFMTPKNPNQATYRILVICPNGIGTGNMIKNEIQHLVPQATEIQNVPLSQYTPNHNFDVVVSTVVLENESKLIIVHPILTDQDRVAILRKCMYNEPQTRIQINDLLTIAKKYIPEDKMDAFENELQNYYSHLQVQQVPKNDYGLGLLHYLQLSHIQICQEAVEWEDALITSCQPLLDNGSITQEYIDAILYDQKECHLYMFLSEGLVLAHSSIDKGVNDIDVALTTFKEPVLFNNGRQAQIIIGMCATDQTKHIRILNDIIEIFSKKKSLEKLANMNTTAEIYQYIQQALE